MAAPRKEIGKVIPGGINRVQVDLESSQVMSTLMPPFILPEESLK